jgi:RNA-directed DNA polymerase
MPQDALANDSARDPWSRVAEMQAKLHCWAAADPGRRFDDLFNFVHDPATLIVAFRRVAGNQGASTAGVDGMTAADVEQTVGVPGFLDDLRAQLKAGTFTPLPVRERTIPKPGGSGKVRKLGIPTITDRVVQAALKLVLEPIFEAGFLPVSYGFRPMRRAHDAVAEIQRYGTKGYRWVLDADIEACFDSISHPALMGRVRATVKDKRVLALVKAFLKAGVLTETGEWEDSYTGTPQGGILTPPTQLEESGCCSPSESVPALSVERFPVPCRTGMEWRIVILPGPTRMSLTSRRSTRWRSVTVAVVARSRSAVRNSSRLSASLR